MRRSHRGGISLYFSVIFMSILLVALSLLDFARMDVYKVQAQRAMDLTSHSLLTNYNDNLQAKYGLFLAEKGNTKGKVDFLLKENYHGGKIDTSITADPGIAINAAEYKEQILEYMKYRGPIVATSKLYEMMDTIKEMVSNAKQLEQRVDTESEGADFLEALNDYRYNVEGWTFKSEDSHKYKINDSKNPYFVRSYYDFKANNPYKPYINMDLEFMDANTVLSDREYSELQEKFRSFESAKNSINKLLEDYEKNTNKYAEMAYKSDVELYWYIDKLEKELENANNITVAKDDEGDGKKSKELKIEKAKFKLEVVKKLRVLSYDIPTENYSKYSIEVNSNNIPDLFVEMLDNYLSLTNLLYWNTMYSDEAFNEGSKEISKAFKEEGAPDDWLVDPTYEPKLAINKWYKESMKYNAYVMDIMNMQEEIYNEANLMKYVLDSLIDANSKAKSSIGKISAEINEYKNKIEAEKSSYAGKQDAYAINTLSQLEDKEKIITQINDRLVSIESNGYFDINKGFLKEQKKLLICPLFGNLEGLAYFDKNELKTKEIKDIKGAKKFKNKIDANDFTEYEVCRSNYYGICPLVHMDFTNTMLFMSEDKKAKVNQPKNNSNTREEEGNGMIETFKKMGSVFNATGENSIAEYSASLPSKGGSSDKLDSPNIDGNLDGIKAIKNFANTIKEQISDVVDMFSSFSSLANNIISVIYIDEYIMNTFNSKVTNTGDYEGQTNLQFEDKTRDGTKLDSEIEYIIVGQNKDKQNVKSVNIKIFLIRLIPNAIYVFTSPEISGYAHGIAAAISSFFPPIEPLVFLVIAMLWACIESAVDVALLNQGYKVAFLKSPSTFICSPTGLPTAAQYLGKAAIDNVVETADKKLEEGIGYVGGKVKNKTDEILNSMSDKTKDMSEKEIKKLRAEVEDYVGEIYQYQTRQEEEVKKTINEYVEMVVSKHQVEVEKNDGKNIPVSFDFSDSQSKQKIKERFQKHFGGMESTVNSIIEEGLQGEGLTTEKILDKVENQCQDKINSTIDTLRNEANNKIDGVIDTAMDEMRVAKDDIKATVKKNMNKALDDSIDKIDMSKYQTSAGVEKGTKSGFKLGYEDYLRLLLMFTDEQKRLLRSLDIIQVREFGNSKSILGSFIAGVSYKTGFEVRYLFLQNLISIANKDFGDTGLNPSDYEKVDFILESSAGY